MSATNALAQRDAAIREALEYSPIAGGAAYQQMLAASPSERVSLSEADVVVRTKAQFLSAVSGSEPRTVGIPGDARIDLTGESFRVRNKTIVSDRGIGDSDGALLFTRDKGSSSPAYNGGISGGMMHLYGSSSLLGVRLRGASHNEHPNPAHPGYIPYRPPEGYNHYRAQGIRIHSDDILIANCELYGWASAAIFIGSSSAGYSPTIAYNWIHDNMMTSAGYGFEVLRGRPYVKGNYFNAHRHAIAGFGFHDCSFVVEDNVFGPAASSHQVDMHGMHNNFSSAATNSDPSSTRWYGQAGGHMIVRNNTFMFTNVTEDANFDRGRNAWAVSVRGVPSPRPSGTGILIERNRCMHAGPQPRNYGVRSFNQPYAFNQQVTKSGDQGYSYPTGPDGFSKNYVLRDNQYNAPITPWEPGYGAPINLENPEDTAIWPGPGDGGLTRAQRRQYYKALAAISRDLNEIHNAVS